MQKPRVILQTLNVIYFYFLCFSFLLRPGTNVYDKTSTQLGVSLNAREVEMYTIEKGVLKVKKYIILI